MVTQTGDFCIPTTQWLRKLNWYFHYHFRVSKFNWGSSLPIPYAGYFSILYILWWYTPDCPFNARPATFKF